MLDGRYSNSFAMEEAYQALHEVCKAIKSDEGIPAHRYWIGIIKHTVPLEKIKDEADLLWIKANKVRYPSPTSKKDFGKQLTADF